jgi:DNA primase
MVATAGAGHAAGPDAAVDLARLYEVNTAAAAFYATQLDRHQPALGYLRSRGLIFAAAPGSPWQLGYAPPAGRTLLDHLAGRGFSVEEISAAGLATVGRHGQPLDRFRDRLTFPIHDPAGRAVAFTARDLSRRPGVPKYVNTPQTRLYTKNRLLYGLGPQLQQPPGDPPLAVVVEGPTDALAIWHATQVAPLSGRALVSVAACGTALGTGHLHLLRDTMPAGTALAVAFDGDPAGQQAFLRAYPQLRTWPGPRYGIVLPDQTDPADLLATSGPAALAQLVADRQPATRMALTATLDQLITQQRITRPREWATDRLLAYTAIAEFLIDDPPDLPALAQVAADRLGLHPGEVVRGVVEHVFPIDLDQPATIGGAQQSTRASSYRWPGPALAPRPHRSRPPSAAPADPAAVSCAHATRQGQRRIQADATATFIDPATDRQAWALVDGIGDRPQAAAAAHTAARIAAQTAASGTTVAAITAAHNTVAANPAAGNADAAITVVTAHPAPGGTRFEVAWCGNVRAYTRLGDQLVQLTTDHTLAQQQHDAGQPVAADSQLHHLLTASVRHGQIDHTTVVLPPGGALLLCTAGAHHLNPTSLLQALGPVRDPQATVDRLLRNARADNATVVLMHAPPHRTGGAGSQVARLARLASPKPSPTRAHAPSPPADATSQLRQLSSTRALVLWPPSPGPRN